MTALQTRFRGKGWVSIKEVLEFVGSDQTGFHSGQAKRDVLVPMEDRGLIEIDARSRRRRHTFPDRTRLRFL